MFRKCITEICVLSGRINLELDSGVATSLLIFACRKHFKEEIKISESMGFSVKILYKSEPEQVCCSLILCKDCMKDLDNVLDY